MKKRTADKFWFPWWPDKWIFGSVRIEFTPAERGIWVDLLSLASKDDGHIRANEETPYPILQLSGMLLIPEEQLINAIEKFIETEKLIRTECGTLYVSKWDKYQFSDRHRRRVEDTMSENSDTMSEKKTPIIYNSKLNKNILNKNKEEKNKTAPNDKNPSKPTVKIFFDFDSNCWNGIEEKDMDLWKETYPAVDIEHELLEMADWLISNPAKRKSNYRAFISRWLSKEQDRGGSQRGIRNKPSAIDSWVPPEERAK